MVGQPPNFEAWLRGLPVLQVADTGQFQTWLRGLPVLQMEAVAGPEGLPYLPPVIIHD